MKIAFIGIGTMGSGMAMNLVKKGWDPLIVGHHDRNRLLPFDEAGAHTTLDPKDAACSECIFLCLPNGNVVRSLLLGEEGLLSQLHSGQIIVDCSTIGYREAREIGKACADSGVSYLDAPVSGHREKAEAGTLTIMAGGREAVFQKVQPLLCAMGATVLYMGPSGSGQLAKMLNNCVLNICTAAFCELMPVGVHMGLDPEKLGEVLTHASGASNASRMLIPEILKGNFSHGFTMEGAYKDMINLQALISREAIPLPTFQGTMQTYQLALQGGEGKAYKGAMIRFYEKLLGVECRAVNDSKAKGAVQGAEKKSDD
jgi:3-hydroxyisobutyrate dehydrogenase-like beta-hydroxyacid dehydrogenase